MDLTKLTVLELRQLMSSIENELSNRSYGVGNTVQIEYAYMQGDSDGDSSYFYDLEIKNDDDLNALNILINLNLNNDELDKYELKETMSDEAYELIYGKTYPSKFKGYELTSGMVDLIREMVKELFHYEEEFFMLSLQYINVSILE